MLRFIGAVVVIGGIIFGVAWYKNYINADIEVSITPKARQAVVNGLDAAQGGANTGLNVVKQKLK